MSLIKPVIIPDRLYFRIGDVAEILGVKPYVIRFWEGEFPFLSPEKSVSGQRVFRKSQIEALVLVKHLLHVERYSIEGAKKKISELRKEAKLKEFTSALVSNSERIDIGTKIPKKEIPVLAITEKIGQLQALIRNPKQLGIDLPEEE